MLIRGFFISGKIHSVKIRKILIIIFILALIALLLYQIPAVRSRVDWGYIKVSTYLRGVINPIGAVPTPLATPISSGVLEPTATFKSPTPTSSEPTLTPLPSPTALPSVVRLESPPFEIQGINNCGPASLSMYLNYYGWDGDQLDVSDVIKPVRQDRNVNVEELAFFAWNYAGWLQTQYRVGGDIELLKTFIANGIPVMIEEGDSLAQEYWPDDDMWAGHFLLLTGYDDAAQTFFVQDSFRGADLEVSYPDTDQRWKAFNRVYILVYLPSQEDTVKEILGPQWDVDYNRQYALDAAQAEIDIDPGDAFALFNLGSSLVYFERYEEAANAYDLARIAGLPQRMFRYQFGPFHAYYHSLRTEELLALIEYALKATANSEEAWLWRGWGLLRQGDRDGAIKAFRESLKSNPNSHDAKYALDYVGANP